MRDPHMSVRSRQGMSEQESTSEPKRKVSEEFAAVQAQLRKEDTLLWMMKEQLPSMMGMMFMFILTIAISLYIRPWYDIAELQAYGVEGARQVRYIALQLVMIFIFTAGILLLAKYKKEWIIKYGIMGVLAIALLYATVPLGNLEGGCTLAFHADDAMYVIDQNGQLVRFNTFDDSPGNLTYQAAWSLPPALKTHESVVYSEVIDDDKVLIVTATAAAVLELESNSGALDLNQDTNDMASVLFTVNATSNFTSADFGHSPWSSIDMNESSGLEGLLLLGDENGDVTGYEWNESDGVIFEPQTRIALLGYGQTIQSVRITDLDESGFSDMLITTGETADWLHTQSLKNRISFDVEQNLKASWFTFSDDSVQFNAVYDNGTTSLTSGPIENGMFALDGPQFSEGPLIAALLITSVLMILLYVHSEWYVVNTVGVLVGSGVIVMLGVTFVPTLIIIFMIAAAIYDAWAVYRSKHMLDLADTMIGLRLPILLVAPQEKGYSFIDETVSMKEKNAAPAQQMVSPSQRPVANKQPKKQSKDAMFMGLGDVIFPGMLVLSSAQYIDGSEGFQIAMATLIGGLVGYFALMTYVARGRAQAGLPLLNGGAILGYIIGGIVTGVGWAIFDFGLTL